MSDTFVLRPRVQVKPLAIAAVAALIGAVGLVAAVAADWPVGAAAVPGVVMLLGIALLVAGVVGHYRGRIRVTLAEDGFQLMQGRRVVVGRWADVAKVTVSGSRLVLVDKSDPATGQVMISPRGADDADFLALQEAISRALDAHRGYHSP